MKMKASAMVKWAGAAKIFQGGSFFTSQMVFR
jgi:hypothetical protein